MKIKKFPSEMFDQDRTTGWLHAKKSAARHAYKLWLDADGDPDLAGLDELRVAASTPEGMQFEVAGIRLPCRLYNDADESIHGLVCHDGQPLIWRTGDAIRFVYGHQVGGDIALQVIEFERD